MTPRELGIRKGEVWAYQAGRRIPLAPARVINQPAHYDAAIVIQPLGDWSRLAVSVRRSKLPCKWEHLDDYLASHPDVPRELETPRAAVQGADADAVDLFSVGQETIRRIVREELANVNRVPLLALNYRDASLATGYSVSALHMAVANDQLVASYANSKPVFRLDELDRWLASLPGEAR
ncbi:hypothetical protein ACEXQE_02335 [Herbiconiux sp. P17]|uniref:hypothetical protein n=1 Tax=Herbiconiux wuyangfengii TaxID=3342794 RepID=UPI0035BAEC50